jgi:translation elongation factor EF-Ts
MFGKNNEIMEKMVKNRLNSQITEFNIQQYL